MRPAVTANVSAASDEVLLSPKDLATAIGASESSLRRWLDGGELRVSRTAGGHRRIPLSAAVQFIRKMGAVVVRPDVLNLPSIAAIPAEERTGLPSPPRDEQRLFDALRDGRHEVARGLVLAWYLQGRSLHELFDGPVRGALHRVGELWKHDERGVLVEHRATDITLAILTAVRALLPPADDSAPLAMGGAPRRDPYQIPSLMAATVLAEAGLRAVNFGADTPLPALAAEAIDAGARLVWLSVSYVADDDVKTLRVDVKRLGRALAARGVELFIGGGASGKCIPRGAGNVIAIGTMGELAGRARSLSAAAAAAPSAR